MIMVYPHDADWDGIAALTGDSSWNAHNMRSYFQRLENCHYRPLSRWLSKLGINPTRHGFKGWLHTEKAIPMVSVGNRDLLKTIAESATEAIKDIGYVGERGRWLVESQLDPNDWRAVKENSFGMRYHASDHPQSRAHRLAGAGDGGCGEAS